jgi:hypothetical protein
MLGSLGFGSGIRMGSEKRAYYRREIGVRRVSGGLQRVRQFWVGFGSFERL